MPRTKYATLGERINASLRKEGECWLWTGFCSQGGYGMLTYRNRTLYAHRAAYEAFTGEVPDGKYVMHTCDEPACCNPAHLVLGSQQQNQRDMASKRRAANQSPLFDDQVREIKERKQPAPELAKKFNVSTNVIYKIWSGLSWQHVE